MTGEILEFEYNCELCNESFNNYSSYYKHFRRHFDEYYNYPKTHKKGNPQNKEKQAKEQGKEVNKAGLAILLFIGGMAVIYVLYTNGFFNNIRLVW